MVAEHLVLTVKITIRPIQLNAKRGECRDRDRALSVEMPEIVGERRWRRCNLFRHQKLKFL